jgi:hypothetical protein
MPGAMFPVVEQIGSDADLPERVLVFAGEIRIGPADAETKAHARGELKLELPFEVERVVQCVFRRQERSDGAAHRDGAFGGLTRLRGRARGHGQDCSQDDKRDYALHWDQ